MSFDPQDPKWSAFVLGELDDEARAQIDRQLAESPDAQRFVDELRRTIDLVSAELRAEPCPAMSDGEPAAGDLSDGEPADGEFAPAAATDDEPGSRSRLFRTVRPEGHSRTVGRLAVIGLAASLLAIVSLGSYLLFPGSWHIRDLKLAWKADSHTDARVAESTPSDGLPLDDSLVEGLRADPYPATDYAAVPTDNEPAVKLQLKSERKDIASTVLSPKTETKSKSINYAVSKPKYETWSTEHEGSAQESDEYGSEPRAAGSPGPHDSRGKQRGIVESLGQVESSKTPFPSNQRVAHPDAETWKELNLRRKKFAAPQAQDGERGAEVDEVSIPFDANAPYGRPGKETQSLKMAVTPKIIIQEEEEDRLGIATPHPVADLVLPLDQLNPHAAEAYEPVTDNPFLAVSENPLSTFSIDVDTASYSIVRRYLQQNHQLPPPSAVRIEELVNYFHYDYPQPEGDKPFAANVEVAGCPWNAEHRLVRLGLKGREVARDHRPLTNLVFLVDVSGSMQSPDKLPLVKESLRLLAEQMGENDRVAIVVYAGSSGLVLPSTSGTEKPAILKALDALEAGGSTNGAQGIQLAYDIAVANFIKGGVNRVILATDGDFNVGVTDRGELVKLIEQKAASGVFLTTLGYGMGNLKDATLEQLADKGNGNYAYIDSVREAKKVLVQQMSGTLVTIAKDVKIQIEFNPSQVAAFRLIGYENRILRHEDFNDDRKDAGEIGAGHTVTALYELVPAGKEPAAAPAGAEPLKYQQKLALTDAARTGELMTLKLRYKQPDGDKSQLLEYPVKDPGQPYARATGDFKFAASVALFGMLLRDSPYRGTASFAAALELAQEGRGSDAEGYRAEFIELISAAKALRPGGG